MNFIAAVCILILIIWMSLCNNRRRKQFAFEEWIECANLMITFHKSRDRMVYERILKLHRNRDLEPQKDHMLRIWLRRVLEHNPRFHTGSYDEIAIMQSETLYSYLPTIISLYKNALVLQQEVIDGINETTIQYGATGSQKYRDYLVDAVNNLSGNLQSHCIVQLAHIS
jgi:hypothetical protein